MWLEYHQLDRATFIGNARRVERRMWLLPALLLLMWGGPMLLLFGVPSFDPGWNRVMWGWTARLRPDTVAYVAIPLWICLTIAVSVLLNRMLRLNPRVRCPACAKSLLDHSAVVIATGNCGECGSRVLSVDSSDQR